MTVEDVTKAVDRFFGDMSRLQQETEEGLREVIAHCESLIESLHAQGLALQVEGWKKGEKMGVEYVIEVEYDLGKAVEPAGKLLDRVNDTMHDFGFPEKLVLFSKMEMGVVTTSEELEPNDLLSLTQAIEEVARNNLGDAFRSVTVRRKGYQ